MANDNDLADLCGAIFLLGYTLWSLAAGSTYFFPRTVKRSEYPLAFWINVVMYSTLGISMMVFVFIDWYHKISGR